MDVDAVDVFAGSLDDPPGGFSLSSPGPSTPAPPYARCNPFSPKLGHRRLVPVAEACASFAPGAFARVMDSTSNTDRPDGGLTTQSASTARGGNDALRLYQRELGKLESLNKERKNARNGLERKWVHNRRRNAYQARAQRQQTRFQHDGSAATLFHSIDLSGRAVTTSSRDGFAISSAIPSTTPAATQPRKLSRPAAPSEPSETISEQQRHSSVSEISSELPMKGSFGYNPHIIHGIGIPDFMMPGPPLGQPLINDNETHDLSSFFAGFESNDSRSKFASSSQFHQNSQTTQDYVLQPTFVGSETDPLNSSAWFLPFNMEPPTMTGDWGVGGAGGGQGRGGAHAREFQAPSFAQQKPKTYVFANATPSDY